MSMYPPPGDPMNPMGNNQPASWGENPEVVTNPERKRLMVLAGIGGGLIVLVLGFLLASSLLGGSSDTAAPLPVVPTGPPVTSPTTGPTSATAGPTGISTRDPFAPIFPPTSAPTTDSPTSAAPTTVEPTTVAPTTVSPTTVDPTTFPPYTPTPVPTTPMPTPTPTSTLPVRTLKVLDVYPKKQMIRVRLDGKKATTPVVKVGQHFGGNGDGIRFTYVAFGTLEVNDKPNCGVFVYGYTIIGLCKGDPAWITDGKQVFNED